VRSQLLLDAAALSGDSPVAYKNRFDDYFVVGVHAAKNKHLEGRTAGDIASERGCGALDVLFDIAIDDDLKTTFAPDTGGEQTSAYALRAKLWRDDRTLIGASDAGAHLDMIDTFAFSTILLQRGVREHAVMSLEEAVHLITDRIARYFGLVDRGLIAQGYNADIVVFDPATVGRGSTAMRYDVPGGSGRIYADAQGVPHVFVNGMQIVKDGEHTGRLPGTVFRSGIDTRTVAMDALRESTPVPAIHTLN
jgi:N-acyl-D-aspartate/D-glutamate deacylase